MAWKHSCTPGRLARAAVCGAMACGAVVACTPYPGPWLDSSASAPPLARPQARPAHTASRHVYYERPPAKPPAPSPRPGAELASIAPAEDHVFALQRLKVAQQALDKLAAQNKALREKQARIDLARARNARHHSKDRQSRNMEAAIALDDQSLQIQQALDRNVAAWSVALQEFVAAKAALHKPDGGKAKAVPALATAP